MEETKSGPANVQAWSSVIRKLVKNNEVWPILDHKNIDSKWLKETGRSAALRCKKIRKMVKTVLYGNCLLYTVTPYRVQFSFVQPTVSVKSLVHTNSEDGKMANSVC